MNGLLCERKLHRHIHRTLMTMRYTNTGERQRPIPVAVRAPHLQKIPVRCPPVTGLHIWEPNKSGRRTFNASNATRSASSFCFDKNCCTCANTGPASSAGNSRNPITVNW